MRWRPILFSAGGWLDALANGTHTLWGEGRMIRRALISKLLGATALAMVLSLASAEDANAQQAYGQSWGGQSSSTDWNRFYHYPYVYYPQNYWGSEYYRSADSLYHRYPPEMRIPVYNRRWHNYYPNDRRYHSGHHFILDVF